MEQMDRVKKLHALIQVLSVGVQIQLTEKSSDNFYSYTVEVHWFILRKTIVFQGFVFQGD